MEREIRIGSELYICQKDISNLAVGDKIRLKDLFNIEIISLNPLKAVFAGEELEKIKIIHWVPSDGIKVIVRSSEGEIDGLGEPLVDKELGNIVQFERFGFVMVDSVLSDRTIVYFAHK